MSRWLQSFFATARKPSGWLGKFLYRESVGHHGFFRAAIARLQLQPEDILLEIGCGGGVLLDMVRPTVQRGCGIDYSPDMVDLAKRKNEQALSAGHIGIVQGNIEALPWGKHTFTCATGVEVLHLIEHPGRTVKELYRVLQPGGRLVLVTAVRPQAALSRLAFAPWLKYLQFYSNDELASMLRQAGFQTMRVQRVDQSAHTVYAHQLACAVK